MLPTILAATEAGAEHAEESTGILGVSLQAFIFQLITFILVFILLKKFAFDKVASVLNERHKVIDEGVRHGLNMKKDREKFEHETEKVVREARHRADEIIGDAQKESRAIIRDAEKSASKKSDAILADAEVRVNEEVAQAKRKLELDFAGLVSEATEAIVEEKVDPKKDAQLIDRALKKGSK